MTALTRTPENTNYLQPTKFLLMFDRIPTVQYFCQSINIPGVSIGNAIYQTPLYDIPVAGEKLTYNQLSLTFPINGDCLSWIELHNWFRAIASPVSIADRQNYISKQTTRSKLTSYSDATLTLLSNLNNPILRVYFYNCFPIALSDIQFDTKSSADDILVGDATFMFEYYNFESA
jgi:hypothetical protein